MNLREKERKWVGDWRKPGKHHANWAKLRNLTFIDYYDYHIFLQSNKIGYVVKYQHEIIFTGPTMNSCFEYVYEYSLMEKMAMNLELD